MGKEGYPETFRAVVHKTNGPKVFQAVEQYTYKPDHQEHIIGIGGIGLEALIELQFLPRRLIPETGPNPSERAVTPSNPEFVTLVRELWSRSQEHADVLTKSAVAAQERASVEQATSATALGDLAQILRDKETGGKTAVHTWAEDKMFDRLHLRMPLSREIRIKYPECFFPGKDRKASMGFVTEDILLHYTDICRVAERMMKLGPADEVRRAEYVDKLKGIGQCFYPLLTWGSTGMLEPRDAFYLALEWMQLPPQANDKKLRVKVAQGMLSTADASDASEQHALKHGLKAVRFSEEMQGFVLPSINSWSEVQCEQGVKESIVATRPNNKWLSGGTPPPKKRRQTLGKERADDDAGSVKWT